MPRLLFLVALAGFWAGSAHADTAPRAAKVPNFSLKDTYGKAWSLAALKDSKAIVVVFLGTECPVNNAYLPILAELHKEYAAKGVQFVAVNANKHDSAERVAEHA